MNHNPYQSILQWANRSPVRCKWIAALCHLLPFSLLLLYAAGSVCAFFRLMVGQEPLPLLFFWLVPAAGFLVVTLLRKLIHSPRPFEQFGFSPLIEHESGSSFPSRHTASAFLISFALLYLFRWGAFPLALVVLSFCLACFTALSRLIAGVHFLRDILSGALIALLISWLGFAVILPIFWRG
jgi:membrane-associated phospholipid phosphatase